MNFKNLLTGWDDLAMPSLNVGDESNSKNAGNTSNVGYLQGLNSKQLEAVEAVDGATSPSRRRHRKNESFNSKTCPSYCPKSSHAVVNIGSNIYE